MVVDNIEDELEKKKELQNVQNTATGDNIMASTLSQLCVCVTKRFSVLEETTTLLCDRNYNDCNKSSGDNATYQSTRNRQKGMIKSVFLDINEPYTRQAILAAFRQSSRFDNYQIVLGPGHGMEAISVPKELYSLTNNDSNNNSFGQERRRYCLQFSEYERIDWQAVLEQKHTASSYMIRKGLSRKAQLAMYTKRHVAKNPTSVLKQAMPETIVIDTWAVWEEDNLTDTIPKHGLADVMTLTSNTSSSANSNYSSQNSTNRRHRLDQCLQEARQIMEQTENDYTQALHEACNTSADKNDTIKVEPPMWILKGSTVNKGAGIYIIHIYEELVDICWTESEIREWVLQRYISNPLLLHGRKFHIRAYALAVSALSVYVSDECLALCAGTPYNQNVSSNTNNGINLLAHITNTAFQEIDPNFREENCVLSWKNDDIAPILVHDGTCTDPISAKNCIEHVMDQIYKITSELFAVYKSEFGVFSPIPECFEHYGLDFLVNDTWNVYLLEVNPGPDFKQTGRRLQSVIGRLMESTIKVAIEEEVDTANNTKETTNQSANVFHLVYDQATQVR